MIDHTPGPWKEGREFENGLYVGVSGHGWSNFAKVVIRMDGATTDRPEGLANLELILAAPTMRSALETISDIALDDDRAGSDRLSEIYEITQKVLSRSNGWRLACQDHRDCWWTGQYWSSNMDDAHIFSDEEKNNTRGLPLEGKWELINDY